MFGGKVFVLVFYIYLFNYCFHDEFARSVMCIIMNMLYVFNWNLLSSSPAAVLSAQTPNQPLTLLAINRWRHITTYLFYTLNLSFPLSIAPTPTGGLST